MGREKTSYLTVGAAAGNGVTLTRAGGGAGARGGVGVGGGVRVGGGVGHFEWGSVCEMSI